MRLVSLGLSKETEAPLELLERVTFTPEILHGGLEKLRSSCDLLEAVILSTCQRTEIYAVVPQDSSLDVHLSVGEALCEFHGLDETSLLPYLRLLDETATAEHLFQVAAGLKAIALGENQIQGQVREAYGVALGAGTTGKITSKLFQCAVGVGKRVRTETRIGENSVSISSLAVDMAQSALAGLDGKTALIIGSGEMSELAAKLLKKRDIGKLILINRTLARAQELAKNLGGDAAPWDSLGEVLSEVDVVISSTAAPHPVIYADAVEQVMSAREKPLFLVDIAMPRDIEPEVASIPNVHLYNLDDLREEVSKNMKGRENEVPQAEAIIEEEVGIFLDWYEALGTLPTVRALRDHAERVRIEELAKALSKLDDVSDEEREIIEQLSRRIVTKLLHHPTVQLKENGNSERSLEAAARKLFGLEERV